MPTPAPSVQAGKTRTRRLGSLNNMYKSKKVSRNIQSVDKSKGNGAASRKLVVMYKHRLSVELRKTHFNSWQELKGMIWRNVGFIDYKNKVPIIPIPRTN